MNAKLKDIIARVETWPEGAQEQAVALLLALEREYAEPYQATNEELAAIDRGLRDVAEGQFATDAEVEAVFAKYRRP